MLPAERGNLYGHRPVITRSYTDNDGEEKDDVTRTLVPRFDLQQEWSGNEAAAIYRQVTPGRTKS